MTRFSRRTNTLLYVFSLRRANKYMRLIHASYMCYDSLCSNNNNTYTQTMRYFPYTEVKTSEFIPKHRHCSFELAMTKKHETFYANRFTRLCITEHQPKRDVLCARTCMCR